MNPIHCFFLKIVRISYHETSIVSRHRELSESLHPYLQCPVLLNLITNIITKIIIHVKLNICGNCIQNNEHV